MNKKVKVLELAFPSTAMASSPLLSTKGGDLVLSLEFDYEGIKHSSNLQFTKVRAFKKLSEIYCTAWHVVDTFDTLCEVRESVWVTEMRAAASAEWRDFWIMRHFIIYVDSFGCIEVIAESVEIDEAHDKKSAGTLLVSQTPFSDK